MSKRSVQRPWPLLVLFEFAFALLVGALLTWFSCWFIAAFLPPSGGISTTPTLFSDGSAAWAGSSRRVGAQSWLTSPINESMAAQARAAVPPAPLWAKPPDAQSSRFSSAYGWPKLAMMHKSDSKAAGAIPDPTWAITLRFRFLPGGVVHLPLRILPEGFAINAVCWTALFVIARSVVLFIRARRRARQGNCPNCGYSREGLPSSGNCPECGTPLTAQPLPSNQPT